MDSENNQDVAKILEQFENFKKELEEVKKKKLIDVNVSQDLQSLNASINKLIAVFERAEQIMESGDEERRYNILLSQNKEIANGIIAVADLVKKEFNKNITPTLPKIEHKEIYSPPHHEKMEEFTLKEEDILKQDEVPNSNLLPVEEKKPAISKPSEVDFSKLEEVPEPKKTGFFSKFKK